MTEKPCCKIISIDNEKRETRFYEKYPQACRKCGGAGLAGLDEPCSYCEFVCPLCATGRDDNDETVCYCDSSEYLWLKLECVDCIIDELKEAAELSRLYWSN